MNILITGASGFLGGHLFLTAKRLGKVIGLTHQFRLPDHGQPIYQLDLNDREALQQVFIKEQPEVVLHNAALANPEYCEKHQDEAQLLNVAATRTVANLCRASGARLIYISTDLVFDGTRGHYSEEDPPTPVNFYGYTKAEAEKVVLDTLPTALVCRLALMFGRGCWQRRYSSEWLEYALFERVRHPALEPLALFSDQYRSMLAVNNAADVLIELATQPVTGILHIGAPQRISRYAFGLLVCQHFGLPTTLIRPVLNQDLPLKVARPADVSLDVSRARQVLETPLLDIAAGIRQAFT